ncbi:MAG: hypothetical protein AB7S26_13235 [Sandaracinaceae bacterium]
MTAAIFVDDAAHDYRLTTNTSPGMALEEEYAQDLGGARRTTWSRGAYER